MATITPTRESKTSNPHVPLLALEHRHAAISFESADGEHGETAYPINYEELYNLKGRLLTLVDATFTDPQQRKAQKDVIWQALQGWMNDIERAAGEEPHGVTKYSESSPV